MSKSPKRRYNPRSWGTKGRRVPRVKPILNDKGMNKLEARYSQKLELMKATGEILDWLYEPMGLRLGSKCFYHPDFLVIYEDRFEWHETKGFMRDDALVKLKASASKFHWFNFYLCRWIKKEWVIEKVK